MSYSSILQHSEEDCGAACLATIAKQYGRHIPISRIRESVGTGPEGTTLLGLRQGAETLGFNARCVKANPEVLNRLKDVTLPIVIHWQGYHWVVLHGKKGNKYIIADPAVGLRYLSHQEVTEAWSDWITLLLEPDHARFCEHPTESAKGFSRFLQRSWAYRSQIAPALLLNIVLGLLSLSTPFLMQILTDDVLVRGDMKLLATVSIGVMVIALISSALEYIQANLIANFAQRLELNLALDFGRQILQLPLSYYESRRSGEIVSRLQDIQQINQLVSEVVVTLPSQFFIASISLGFMFFYSWKLSLAAILSGALMTISTIIFLPTLRQKTQETLIVEAENQGLLVETFKGALTLKTTLAAPQFWEEIQIRFARLANLVLKTTQIGIINHNFASLVSHIGGIALIWFGGTLVINPNEHLSIGQLLAFKAMTDNFLGFITATVKFTDELTHTKTSVQRISEVISALPESSHRHPKPTVALSPQAEIRCDNVSFHYPGRLELLDNFSITMPGGRSIALIGQSGCGKSTLSKLMAGLYVPPSGNIRVGAYNLQDIDLESLRHQVILVPQDAHFWSRSILENFRLGNPNISFEQVVQACQLVGADDFISRLPEKYQTVLGEFGANLSGGQRQRLAIARALISNPPILILDESTAGLDPVSEAQVLDRLLEYRQGKTTILISHRPRVIRRADWIVHLAQGRLTVQGTLDDLMNSEGDHLAFLLP
jgi:ATP-binding cassette, subfamily C, bacterial